ncbi:MAG TPA: hypothetical protein VK735_45775 [Pseudonocardia sp.]|uniref:hypothetical protein n=1 Tax=Pseudonocardia sp. TaxID=60912 RepID=UPI002BB56B6E|nr:hypothetical protein [Pseudonocardia sp.]HTF54799.1 hypothetical protein [Pseudonocardia sp.]
MGTRPRGPQPHWEPRTPRQRAILSDLLGLYSRHSDEGTLPRGPRGAFYDLRPIGSSGIRYEKRPPKVPGTNRIADGYADQQAVAEVLNLARRAGMIPEDWIADTRTPDPLVPLYDDDPEQAVADAVRAVKDAGPGYRLDPQTGQRDYLEIWSEARELTERIARTATPLGVPVYSGGGFDSIKVKRRTADRVVARAQETGQATVILHIGDLDPHGESIVTAFTEDVTGWILAVVGSSPLHVERIALTQAQAARWGLLDADGKAEADGIPVRELDQLITSWVSALRDEDRLTALRERELTEQHRVRASVREEMRRWVA